MGRALLVAAVAVVGCSAVAIPQETSVESLSPAHSVSGEAQQIEIFGQFPTAVDLGFGRGQSTVSDDYRPSIGGVRLEAVEVFPDRVTGEFIGTTTGIMDLRMATPAGEELVLENVFEVRPCEECTSCDTGGECPSSVCGDGFCRPAQCDDGAINGNETDVDCGGSCKACALGDSCVADSDCQSNSCPAGTCELLPRCDDGTLNGDETDIDCGGSCGLCALGSVCIGDGDCKSNWCLSNACSPPPTDCAALLAERPSAATGIWNLDPDGVSGEPPIPVFCDMDVEGGGWTRVAYEPAGAGSTGVAAALPNWGVESGAPPDVALLTAPGMIGPRFSSVNEVAIVWGSDRVAFAVSENPFTNDVALSASISSVRTSNSQLADCRRGRRPL